MALNQNWHHLLHWHTVFLWQDEHVDMKTTCWRYCSSDTFWHAYSRTHLRWGVYHLRSLLCDRLNWSMMFHLGCFYWFLVYISLLTRLLSKMDKTWIWGISYPVAGPVWPRGFQEVGAPRFSWHAAHEGGEVVSLTHRSPLPPRKCSWYSFSLGAESTPGPWCGRKEICHWKIRWHHRESIPGSSN
jgi:hypothetical protein